MAVYLLLIIILVFALIGGAPVFQYSAGWGWGPSGLVGGMLIVMLIAALIGRL
jgi:hypothetical protein